MSRIETLHDLLVHELKDLYSAETQLVKALPKMAKAATNKKLKEGFARHLDQTKEHVARLERIAKMHDFSPKGKKCLAMEGLVSEGEETISEDASDAIKDAALIGAAQKVEHYEIAGYGTARTFAALLGYEEACELLQSTLDEEGATDERLTELAASINVKAGQRADSDR